MKYINESNNSSVEYFIPTYEECLQICESNDNLIFFESHHNVDGYNISIFNYRLAQPKDFEYEDIEISDGKNTIFINGNKKIGNKKISDYTDDEIELLGFEFLSKFKS